MLNFRSKSNVPNYLGRAYQRRLLYLVGGLALVLFCLSQAGSGNFQRLWYVFTQEPQPEVDTAIPPPAKRKKLPGEFVAMPKRKPIEQDPDKPFYQRVRPELMQTVRDNSPFTATQRDAFAHLWDILGSVEQSTIKAAPAQRVTFIQLWSQSEEYRGKLVTISGHVRGAAVKNVRREDYGIDRYYELWLQHDGVSNATSPIVVYCLELPEQFPLNMEIDERVEITGFYYRRRPYQAQDRQRLAPVILAKSPDWSPAAKEEAAMPMNVGVLIGLAALAAVVAAAVVVYVMSRDGSGKMPEYVRRHMKGADAAEDELFFPPGN